MAEKVYTKNAPDAIGPYTQAIKTNGFVFTSGQIAINPQTGNVEATTIEDRAGYEKPRSNSRRSRKFFR